MIGLIASCVFSRWRRVEVKTYVLNKMLSIDLFGYHITVCER